MIAKDYKLITDYRDNLILEFKSNNQNIKFNLHEYYADLKLRIQTNLKKEPLFKLIKPRQIILDATSGLLQDSLILAKFSEKIIAIEISKEVYELQKIILERILNKDPLFRGLVQKIDFLEGDSASYNKVLNKKVNLLYVDLMFEDNKKAAPKKSKQLLRILANQSSNYPDFIEIAKASNLKLIIKSNNKNLLKTEPSLQTTKVGNLHFHSLPQ
ncbi:MAG: class I SAM-dependent methyltransferase [Rickettsiales bacterium]|jgi:16S rRNA (guanine1516-N2)-methyltransferase|nr:class I SAM-dependent methyltransferase [Rickettsiales bacterium]